MQAYVQTLRPRALSILVVEDDPDTRELIIEVLGATGAHTILPAASAEEALALLRTTRCDVVVTDIGLPAVSGLEMLDRANAEGLLANAAVLVCSAHEELRQQVVLAGATFIPKPLAFDNLGNAICERIEDRPPTRRKLYDVSKTDRRRL